MTQGQHRKRRLQQLFVAVGTSFPSYLATIGRYINSLPSNDIKDTHVGRLMRGFLLNYAVEMDLVDMLYIPSLIKVCSAIRKIVKGDSQTHRHTDSMETA
jgi:hypothetical protein